MGRNGASRPRPVGIGFGETCNAWLYGEPDAAELAAGYAFGIARSHPFVDGNKRVAWILARLFLELNGHEMIFGPAEAISIMLSLAAGEISEGELAAWFRQHLGSGA